MIAGPNGSGKTTLTRELRIRGVDLGVYINPDDIAAELRGAYAARVAAAQAEADRLRDDCLSRRVGFSFETVMSHPSKVEILSRAKDAGYFVILYFIATEDPALNVARVKQRVALGGHDVPADRIVARYHRALTLLLQAMALSDHCVLFDNTYRAAEGEDVVLRPFFTLIRTESGLKLVSIPPIPLWAREAIASVS